MPGRSRRCSGRAVASSVREARAVERARRSSKKSAYRSRCSPAKRKASAMPISLSSGFSTWIWRGARPLARISRTIANGQPRAVAERLAVHDQRVRLDPLDGHAQMTESSRTPAPLKMKRATGLPLWSPGRRLYEPEPLEPGVDQLADRPRHRPGQGPRPRPAAAPRRASAGRVLGCDGGDRWARSTPPTRSRAAPRRSPAPARTARCGARSRAAAYAGVIVS